MANAIAMRAIRWTPDGGSAVDVQRADLGIHLEIVMGLDETPGVRGEDWVIPGRTGIIPGNRIGHIRPLELAGWVQGVMGPGQDEADRMDSYRDLVAILQAGFDPRLTGVLEVDLEDGSTTQTIAARPGTMVWGPETPIPGVRTVSIALESTTSPDWTVVP